MNISVVGTGYVGLVVAACFAENGNDVVGVDIVPEKIDKLKKGEVPIYEPGLEEIVKRNLAEERLSFTTDLKSSVEQTEIIFIAVGTPPDEDGSADMRHVLNVAEAIGRPEESFMAGGDERDMRWLGPTFAAALMRVCDRSDLRPVDFVGVPEHLFDQPELVGWIARNIDLAEEAGITVEHDIDNDAKRFLRAVGHPSSNTG